MVSGDEGLSSSGQEEESRVGIRQLHQHQVSILVAAAVVMCTALALCCSASATIDGSIFDTDVDNNGMQGTPEGARHLSAARGSPAVSSASHQVLWDRSHTSAAGSGGRALPTRSKAATRRHLPGDCNRAVGALASLIRAEGQGA